jgi:RND family efflux transporter MFP subunit
MSWIMKRVAAIVAGLVGSIAAAFAVLAAQPATAPAPAQAVTTVSPLKQNLTRKLLATGSIFAWQEIIIAPEVGGYQVVSVNVEIGDHVKRGQELARLSSGILESQASIARASLMQSQAMLTNADAALARGEMMIAKGALSKADIDTLRANGTAAQANVASARANLDAAELRVRFTRVRAPDDGVVTARSVNVGQVVQAGTEILRLLRRGRVEWRAEVPEADMRQVKAGQLVAITTSEGTTLQGKVRIVAPTVQNNNRTGLVYVDIPGNDGARPGMFARGEISVSVSAALTVPVASVLTRDGYNYVFTLKTDGTVQRRRVTTAGVTADRIEITQGVTADDRIVASGVVFLSDGQRVQVRPAT